MSLTPERLARLLQTGTWACLVVLVLAIYAQSVGFDFINLDDPQYVAENSHVQQGVTAGGLIWAFTSVTVGNWVPLTMLSHMVTSQVFGLGSGWHHLVNVLLHLIASGLLFLFLRRATGNFLASAFVTLVFAVHPLHVESVAWVSERKDVLSAVFFFLALLGYVRYLERPGLARYLPVLIAFGCGLMCKPMLITFPFVLLLLDFWPFQRTDWRRALLEMLPFLALSAGEAAGTYWIQSVGGSVQSLPLLLRISNAVAGYVTYIKQTFWPARLAVFYPYPQAIPAWQVAAALIILATITVAVCAEWRKRPYLAVGWFWYLGMLVPVVGFVQTGYQSHADRYMYLPMIGLTIMLAWGARELAGTWPGVAPLLAGTAGLALLFFTVVAWRNAAHWENNETLFGHALEVTANNWLAHRNLGSYLTHNPDRRGEAVGHLEAALSIRPEDPETHNNLGATLADAGLCTSAIPHFEASLVQTPNSAPAHLNLARCLLTERRYPEAAGHLEAAIRKTPNDAVGQQLLGQTLSKIPGREAEALQHLEAALKLNPDLLEAHQNLADVFASRGETENAIRHLEAAQHIRPDPGVLRRITELRLQGR